MSNESLIEKLKEIMNYAGSCAEGPTDPEFTQFITIEADLKAIISHLESKAAQLPKEQFSGRFVNPRVDAIAKAIFTERNGKWDYNKWRSDPRIAEAYRCDAIAAIHAYEETPL